MAYDRDPFSEKESGLFWPIVIAISAAVVLFMGGVAFAHEAMPTSGMPEGWRYPIWCCQGGNAHGDCQRIHHSTVKPVNGGYQVTLVPGDHPKVTKPQTYFIAQKDAKDSPDGEYHICLYPTEDKARCFFAPVPGV